ncbi:class A sortase [Vagococcus luciliae]|uniref:Sortase A n=1 Tax=Vagococcus luciliae TaxID=2920380 RepID=A0ABY5NWY8_9ENTE|nr:class A sortase [Vagococcus luciliae]UUV98161.1 Sortase A [Vagococcus luciliae]
MKKRQELRKNKQKLNRKRKLILWLSFMVILVSLVLLFNESLTSFVLKSHHAPNISQTTKADIKKHHNESEDSEFDFEKSSKADIKSALKSTFKDEKVPVLGGITIPDLNINLPILRGVSDYAILMGAGTMKKDQEMGKGNYSLTSHHMLNQEVLFGPIIHAKIDMPIYLTDLENVYEYRVTNMAYIQATDVHVIEDNDNKAELTLITCDETGEGRFMLKASFFKQIPVELTEKKIMNFFYQKQNLYE